MLFSAGFSQQLHNSAYHFYVVEVLHFIYFVYESCIITGHLILHVTSDTYIQLGLEGRPSWYNKLGMNKYGKRVTFI